METQKRLETIILPEVSFQNVTLNEAIEFLRKEAVRLSADGKGVEMVIDSRVEKPALRMPDGLDDELRKEILKLHEQRLSETTNSTTFPPITLNLREIPLSDTLKLVTELGGVWFRIRTNTVVIGRFYPELEARVYRLPPERFERMHDAQRRNTYSTTKGSDSTYMAFLSQRRQVIVVNNSENLDLFEQVLPHIGGERISFEDNRK